jgi:phosphomannomutase / phosphoglucomutase
MAHELFGKYDIRGVLGADFNEGTYKQLGVAFGQWLTTQTPAPTNPWVAVGCDVRTSSPACTSALIEGLTRQGVNVLQLGMVPSPLAYFAECFSADAAARTQWQLPATLVGSLVVTASHNPPEYNGLKMTYQQLPLMPENIQTLKQYYQQQQQGHQPTAAAQPGQVLDWAIMPPYLAWLKQTEPTPLPPLTVVVDCANAATSPYAPEVLARCGVKVIPLFAEPDGQFPNHHPDPCVPENLALLQQAVLTHKADLGVSYDGDGDRLGIVDNLGRILPGDMLTLLLFKGLCQTVPDPSKLTLVSEVKVTRHLFDAVRAVGATPVLSLTGHSFMKRKVREANAELAGELSGHVVFRDRHWGFDDAIYNTVRFIAYLGHYLQQHPGHTLAHWVDTLPATALSPERRVPCTVAQRDALLATMAEHINQTQQFIGQPVERVETLDGVRAELPGGFCLVRGSNTEPCLTLRTEAPNAEALALWDAALVQWVNAQLA